jgi:hypothetical protein
LSGAQKGFSRIKQLTDELGIHRATPKDQPPTQLIHFIGYLIDTVNMVVSIDPVKIQEIIHLLKSWEAKHTASKHQLQQILGKLHYVSRCCPPARLFVGRMLHTLRMAPDKGQTKLGTSFQADIAWFVAFLPQYNAIHLINPPKRHFVIQCTIRNLRVVAQYRDNVYSFSIPVHHTEMSKHCHVLWAIFACAKLWSSHWNEAHVLVNVPSTRVVTVINTGASRIDAEMRLARNIWLLSAVNKFTINAAVKIPVMPLNPNVLFSNSTIEKLDHINDTL